MLPLGLGHHRLGLLDGGGTIVGASLIARDVTGEKQREQELRRAQRAEGTARLAAGVAHDFSSLLTEIAGNSDRILARLPEADPLRANAERIREFFTMLQQ